MVKRKKIFIRPKMRGVFTAKAKKAGKSVQGYASQVIKRLKGKAKSKAQTKLLRQAVFAKNAKGWARRRRKK